MSQKAITDNLYKRAFVNVVFNTNLDSTFDSIEAGYRKLGLICCFVNNGVPYNYQFIGSSLTGAGWYSPSNWKKIPFEDGTFSQSFITGKYLSPNNSTTISLSGYNITKFLLLEAYSSFTFSRLQVRSDFAYCHVFDANFAFLGALVNSSGSEQSNYILTKSSILAQYPTAKLVKLCVQSGTIITSNTTFETVLSGINTGYEVPPLVVSQSIGQSTIDLMSQKAATDNFYKRAVINIQYYISLDETFNSIEAGYRKLGLICCFVNAGVPYSYQFYGSSLTGSGWYSPSNWKKIPFEDGTFSQSFITGKYLSPNNSTTISLSGYNITKFLLLEAYSSFTFSRLQVRSDFAYCHVFDANFAFLGALVNSSGSEQSNYILTKSSILAQYPTAKLVKLCVQSGTIITSNTTFETVLSGINTGYEVPPLVVSQSIGQSTIDLMSQKAATDNFYKRAVINIQYYISLDETFNSIEAGYRKLGLICCFVNAGVPYSYQFYGSSLTGSGWYSSANWKKIPNSEESFIASIGAYPQQLITGFYLSPNSVAITTLSGYNITKMLFLDAYTSFTFSVLLARTDFAYCHAFDANYAFLGALVNTGAAQNNYTLNKSAILALYPTAKFIKLCVQSATITANTNFENVLNGINGPYEIISPKLGLVSLNYATSLDNTFDSVSSIDRKLGLIVAVTQSGLTTNYQFTGNSLTGSGWSSALNWKKVSYYEDNNAEVGVNAALSNYTSSAVGPAIMLEPAPFDGTITEIKMANPTNASQLVFKVYNYTGGAYVEAASYTYASDYTATNTAYRFSVNIPILKGQFLGTTNGFYWGYSAGSRFWFPANNNTYTGIFFQYFIQKKIFNLLPINPTVNYKNRWENKIIVLDGDSISSTDYPWYAAQMKAKTNALAVYNNGQSGGKASGLGVTSRLQSKVYDYNPDLIIVMETGNHDGAAGSVGTFASTSVNGLLGEPVVTELAINYDYVSGTEPSYIACIDLYQRKILAKYRNIRANANLTGSETEAEKKAKIDAVKKTRLVFLTGLPQKRYNSGSSFSLPANWERNRQAIIEVCTKNGVPYIDTMKIFSTELDWVLEPYWNSPTDKVTNNGIYTMDGLHPNEYGYDYLTNILADKVNGI